MLTSKQIKREWKLENGWYQNPDTLLRGRLGDWVKLIDGVKLGGGHIISSVQSKYVGTLTIGKTQVQIRIGCETHSIAQWESHGDLLAALHGETQWWNETGRQMLAFLISEANLYTRKYLKKTNRDSKGRFCK